MKKHALTVCALALAGSCWSGEELKPKITNHVEDWRDEVIYQLMTDRFADGDLGNNYNVDRASPGKYHGGDFAGIVQKIPYLKQLGVTTLWISPVVKNVESDAGFASYHGYWTQDFGAVNPHFGDLASLRHMVDTAHENGMKVVLDIVTNHVGQLFYYDINGNGQPDERAWTDGAYTGNQVVHVSEWDPNWDPRGIMGRTATGEFGPAPIRFLWMPDINRIPPMPEVFQNPSWYHRRGRVVDPAGWNDIEQVEKGDFPGGLKDLNTERQDVRDALFEAYAKWIETADFDGFRIDTVKHVEEGFWMDFCPRIRKRAAELGKNNFLMFGEVFDGDNKKVGQYTHKDMLDTLFNFAQKYTIDGVFKYGAGTSQLKANYEARYRDFSGEPSKGIGLNSRQTAVNFLDNHDVPRFLYDNRDVAILHAALAYVFFEEGIPNVFYGTEQEFHGGNDPANRDDLWKTGFSTETPTFKAIARLAELRRKHSALRRGTMTFTWATDHVKDELDAGIVAFERADEAQTALVVINTSHSHVSKTGDGTKDMKTSFAGGTVLTDEFTGEEYTVAADGTLQVQLQPHQVMLLVEP